MDDLQVFDAVANLYKIIPLEPFRHTPGVWFDLIPKTVLPRIDSMDRVIHQSLAISPGHVGEVLRPWYMHPFQDDNLVVLQGTRFVDIYTREHGKVESFVVSPHQIRKNGELLFEGPALLVWPRGVFHRIQSDTEGSASLNFAVHYPGFDIRTNFNVYDLDTEKGRYKLIRPGYEDQDDVIEM